MAVKARFQVNSIEQFSSSFSMSKLRMVAVAPGQEGYGGPEDEAFWNATPTGNMEITITNPAAAEQFQPGDRFDVTFERLPKINNAT
jgi:hypothetical protein